MIDTYYINTTFTYYFKFYVAIIILNFETLVL
jgi:hypothetical protein